MSSLSIRTVNVGTGHSAPRVIIWYPCDHLVPRVTICCPLLLFATRVTIWYPVWPFGAPCDYLVPRVIIWYPCDHLVPRVTIWYPVWLFGTPCDHLLPCVPEQLRSLLSCLLWYYYGIMSMVLTRGMSCQLQWRWKHTINISWDPVMTNREGNLYDISFLEGKVEIMVILLDQN